VQSLIRWSCFIFRFSCIFVVYKCAYTQILDKFVANRLAIYVFSCINIAVFFPLAYDFLQVS